MRVDKPWGYEIRWAITDKYLGKILHINPNSRLSRQYHEQKKETIYVLEGTLYLEIGNQDLVLEVGERRTINPNTVHRFCARDESCTLIEVSTPEIDDVIRLEDDYSRV